MQKADLLNRIKKATMLQLRTAGFQALQKLERERDFPPAWNSMKELEVVTNNFHQRFLDERFEQSKSLGGFFLLNELLDRALRSSETENMDNENLSGDEKLTLVKALDRQNEMMGLYNRYPAIILPLAEEIARKENRSIRLLELASGSGGLALALAHAAKIKNIPLSVTGSDIVPAYQDEANRLADEKQLPVTFRIINAFDMDRSITEPFDLVVISQSLHHFTPGQLAMIIAQAGKQASTLFIGIDGYRDPLLMAGVPLTASLQGIPSFTLDGFISARKFYSNIELDIIAGIAKGRGSHSVQCSWPMSVMTVDFKPE
ncbi:class I SAM-dependent methyltransferase [Chlorobium phaeobacteroides]|jgi:2-polyprenyl-3-methyl-5-hydroxy-6-metoxy-1,4-benzoquinol methylase|uniref:Methyltransferase type 12 n=1 Tax=Chlorobium phaeobacteroides (strain DSM 266 / SMG 266 / 2430) TaxID=290317 RepID=A1BDT8_CHLPD|nr:class I SAM-dependent methyltransferase [Chlorobium phaeobacteroides]ABL64565.1 Methyltransferase type 12 [Chlorobium phaeobacteroides DSM 266]